MSRGAYSQGVSSVKSINCVRLISVKSKPLGGLFIRTISFRAEHIEFNSTTNNLVSVILYDTKGTKTGMMTGQRFVCRRCKISLIGSLKLYFYIIY